MVLTKEAIFRFKKFEVCQSNSAMKISSDGVLLGAWVDVSEAKDILDIGTGTGLISLMCAQKNDEANIVGVEIDQASCLEAKSNFANSDWNQRLEVVSDSIQSFGKTSETKFDHIVSNPPFFSGGTLSDNQPKNVVRHTIKLAHGDLLLAIRRLLKPNGKVSMILPVIEGLRFIELVERYRFYINRKTIMRPRASKPSERVLFEFSPMRFDDSYEENEIVMYKEGVKEYTDQYKTLTDNFYL